MSPSRALWDYLVGYRCHRMGPRETLYQVAQTYNTTIQAIWAGNCGLPAGGPVPGQIIRVPLPCPVVDWDAPYESALEAVFLEGLHARCRWLTSETLAVTPGGRHIWALRIGTGPRRILATGGHHGSEWITGLLLWEAAGGISDGGAGGGGLRRLSGPGPVPANDPVPGSSGEPGTGPIWRWGWGRSRSGPE